MRHTDPHWRDSARSVRFFIWDAKTVFPFLLFIMHIRLWTFIVAASVTLFFTLLNRYGFSIMVFMRMLRGFLAGKRKVAIPWWEHHEYK